MPFGIQPLQGRPACWPLPLSVQKWNKGASKPQKEVATCGLPCDSPKLLPVALLHLGHRAHWSAHAAAAKPRIHALAVALHGTVLLFTGWPGVGRHKRLMPAETWVSEGGGGRNVHAMRHCVPRKALCMWTCKCSVAISWPNLVKN